MINCQAAREQLGAYADGEISSGNAAEIEQHVRQCPTCTHELAGLRQMIDRFADATAVKVPPELWSSIERRLDEVPPNGQIARPVLRRRWLFAAAAGMAAVIGGGLLAGIWLRSGADTAMADEVNFELLLDELAVDVDSAFGKFVRFHQAEPIVPEAALTVAADLRFAVPRELPRGFQLEKVYRFALGAGTGIAASYRSGREPMLVFFHRPTHGEHLGMRAEVDCIVEGQQVHSVEVGPWRLVHFTDPTTCHCVLSKLDVEKDLPAVFAAIAPDFKTGQGRRGH